ncbi:MAG: hypothetical protein MUO58_19190 [Anaerolineales bacterium]|nr:hypothetical protein [Anaerolineales bacterium]
MDHFIILSERHLYRIVKEYTGYFNYARPHQGIAQQIPCQPACPGMHAVDGQVVSIPMLGGLHHDYHRIAA